MKWVTSNTEDAFGPVEKALRYFFMQDLSKGVE